MGQRSRRHSLSGEPWKTGGACAGTVRPATLSRTRGSTTSGLFSDFLPLESSEFTAVNHLKDSQEHRDPGQTRRQVAEAVQRSQPFHFRRAMEEWWCVCWHSATIQPLTY